MMKDINNIFQIPLNINWHEGMLLSQHHFQQNDLRNFHVLAHQIRLLSSNHFGVCHLRIDNVALPDGIYRINEIEAVFPDGLIYSFFRNSGLNLKSLEINILDYIKENTNEIDIKLVIARSIENSSPILGNPARYYSVEGDIVQDQNIAENEIRIPRLFPNAFLYAGDDIPEMCIGFTLCKIIRLDGVFHVKNWTPPCFFIEKHFPLWKRCSILASNLREKAVFLSDKLKNRSYNSNSEYSSDTEFLLRQIIEILPGFEAVVYSNHIRPYELYTELAKVLGSVSCIIPEDIIPIMKPYDHNDIDSSILPIISLIEHYISLIERGYGVLLFTNKERFFYKYISEEEYTKFVRYNNNRLYIGIKSRNTLNFDSIDRWMEGAIIVSDFAIENVRTKRVQGLRRNVMSENLVSKIMPRSGIRMFEIEIDQNFIKPEQNLHIFNPGDDMDSRPSEINIYIPRDNKK